MAKSAIIWLVLVVCSVLPRGLLGQAAGSVPAEKPPVSSSAEAQNERLAKLEQQIADSKGSADNAWMLTSAALVLMMTGPGLALFYGGLVRKKNVIATVVHITSGVSALVCALYLGRRLGYPKQAMPPHSVVLSFIGACLLWVGWFGFNAGSALGAGSLATSA